MHHLEVLIQVQKIKALGIERRGSDTRHGPSLIRYIQAWLLRSEVFPILEDRSGTSVHTPDRCRYPTFYGYPDRRNRSKCLEKGLCHVVCKRLVHDGIERAV